MGFILFFAVVFILVVAFKSTRKEETVTKTDVETGRTTVETHVTNTPSAAQTAARIVLGIIGGIFLLLLLVICSNM